MSVYARHWNRLKPAEHGSWSLLLTPFLIGAGLAVAAGHPARGAAPALALFALLALSAFLVRQPVSALLRVWRGRARREVAGLDVLWTVMLSLLIAACGLALIAMGRGALLIVAIPAGVALLVSLSIAALHKPRGLALEIVGALGLALASPGAYVAVTGALDGGALAAWSLSAAHSLISVLYVRLRVATRRDRVSRGTRASVALSHLLAFVGVLVAGTLGALPWLAILPFGLLLARALWVAWRVPPLDDVRRFGFTEMGLALVFVVLVVLAYLALQ